MIRRNLPELQEEKSFVCVAAFFYFVRAESCENRERAKFSGKWRWRGREVFLEFSFFQMKIK